MAEFRIKAPQVTAVLASADACDRLSAPTGARVLRTAPREALLVGAADIGDLREQLGEPTAIVEDVSDGWTAFVLTGDDVDDVFARLSELPPPVDWLQGEVARSPATVLAAPGSLTILVPANLYEHVKERLRTDAAEVLA